MPISVEWYDSAHTIIHYNMSDPWNDQELISTRQQTDKMINSVKHTIHFIVDLRNSKQLPSDMFAIARSFEKKRPHNVGATVMVGAHPVIKAFVEVLKRLGFGFIQDFYFAATVEEAQQLLNDKESN